MKAFETFVGISARGWDFSREWNCVGDAADCFFALFGVDPVASLRGRFLTSAAAARAVAKAGGLDTFAEEAFQAAGLEAGAPATGSIGIGETDVATFGGRMAMICIEPGLWVGKASRGATMIEANNVRAWRCPA